jgi:hypothetical protein
MRPHSATLAVAFAALASTMSAPSRASAQADSVQAAPKVVKHTVKPGDTLWDIAQFYLKDPFKWPSVFHANTDIIKNPHWIYPGQVLTIEGTAVKEEVAAQADADGFVPQPRAAAPPSGSTVFLTAAPVTHTQRTAVLAKPAGYTVRQGEYEASPFVVDAKRPYRAGRIVGPVERPARGLTSEAGFKVYDRIYVTAPAGVSAGVGTELVLARSRESISDVGNVIQPTGIVRIDSIAKGNLLIGTIVRQFQAVRSDELTVPYDYSFVPTTTRPVNGSFPLTAAVLWISNKAVLPSLQDYVIVHATSTQGVQTGDRFTIYDKPVEKIGERGIPNATVTVQIVRVTPFAATGIIIDQTQPMVARGMASRLTAKMP